jgi:hypothetical protein
LYLFPASVKRAAVGSHLAGSCRHHAITPFSKHAALWPNSSSATSKIAFATGFAARRQQAGRPINTHDTEIAGIALSRRATLATRNVIHFHGPAAPVLNPWQQK